MIQKCFLPSKMSFNTQLQSWQGRRKIACWQGFLDQLRLKQGQKIILFQFFLFQSYFARSFPKKGFLLCEKRGSSSLDHFFFTFMTKDTPMGMAEIALSSVFKRIECTQCQCHVNCVLNSCLGIWSPLLGKVSPCSTCLGIDWRQTHVWASVWLFTFFI